MPWHTRGGQKETCLSFYSGGQAQWQETLPAEAILDGPRTGNLDP